MATHNIKMRKRNGSEWDTLYPITLASNVTTGNGKTVENRLNTIFDTIATPTANGAMSAADKNKLDGIAVGANKYVHPSDANTRHVTDAQIALWNDKYNKLEIDNKFNELSVGLDWKESVPTFADIATTYPNPVDGWTVNVKDTDITYRYTGSSWIQISANSIPIATQTVDGKMSKTDKRILDNLKTTVSGIELDLQSITQGFTGDISGLLTRVTNTEKNITNLTDAVSKKANSDHNHDTKYSLSTHTHDYSPSSHRHTEYYSVNGGTLLGNIDIKNSSNAPTITLRKADNAIVGKLRANSGGDVVLSAGESKTICIRPNGDESTSGQLLVRDTGVTFNGRAVSLEGHGNHVPTLESNTSTPKFLRSDNTWQQITPALISAAASNHNHDTVYSKLAHTHAEYLSISGGTLTGSLTLESNDTTRNLQVVSKRGDNLAVMSTSATDGDFLFGGKLATDTADFIRDYIRISATKLQYTSSSRGTFDIYHTGKKPTATDVGAYTKAESDAKYVIKSQPVVTTSLSVCTPGTTLG